MAIEVYASERVSSIADVSTSMFSFSLSPSAIMLISFLAVHFFKQFFYTFPLLALPFLGSFLSS